MIVRNAYTGALHEVPDQQLYEVGEPVYDGLGNPVGGIFDDIVGAVKNVVTAPIQAATSLMNPAGMLSSLIPGMRPGQAPGLPGLPGFPLPFMPGMPQQQSMPPQQAMPYRPYFRPPFP